MCAFKYLRHNVVIEEETQQKGETLAILKQSLGQFSNYQWIIDCDLLTSFKTKGPKTSTTIPVVRYLNNANRKTEMPLSNISIPGTILDMRTFGTILVLSRPF